MPIAVVGMAFRFPGDLNSQDSFWQALCEGRDSVTQIDPKRWATEVYQHDKRSEPGRSITFNAGVLSRIDEFDADFFGIAPREASSLDPQQRMLLEMSWEAMENGGHVPSSLAGSDCAVFVGISGIDYGMQALDDLSILNSHTMTGNTMSIAANRLSYIYDLRGPSMAVDTACSSSLVALHQACSAISVGDASMAMVGGVNLLLHPYPFIGFTKASMLSDYGQCRPFDASGMGYVRAEGGAILLLKPLDQALADGDSIDAVIRGIGANADGAQKTGIMIPSNEGQVALMKSVLARSGLTPDDIDYLEAHGTGTAVGDPIETAAIGEVYGAPRKAGALPIGSVKSNLGHLESASGMAGFVKAVLTLKHRSLPPSIKLKDPNPRIDFDGLNLEVVTELRELDKNPADDMVVAINSFGFGGANAHVLLQRYHPDSAAPAAADDLPGELPPLFLSARSLPALRAQAGLYAERIASIDSETYYDVAYTAAHHRERMRCRLGVRAADASGMAEALENWAQGEAEPCVVQEDQPGDAGPIAFVYAGNGAQWQGMGQQLIAESPRFAELMSELDAAIEPLADFSVLAELDASEEDSRLDDTSVAQPLLFAIQVALTSWLREQGVSPAAVVGHSVGEVAAAWACGALALDQAVEVICARSRTQDLTRGSGRMAAVALSADKALEWIEKENVKGVELAGINSPNNVTLSGALTELRRLQKLLEAKDIFFRILDLDYAFHSQLMDPVESHFREQIEHVELQSSEADYYSTVSGGVLDGSALDADYWWQNVRKPVLFADALGKMVADGYRIFVEISPHAILQRYISECLKDGDAQGRVLGTVRKGKESLQRLSNLALQVALLVEESPDLALFFPVPGQRVQLPTYAWQRESYWHSESSEGCRLLQRNRVHPLLGWRLQDTEAAWENVVDTYTHPWLADHQVDGAIVLPGAGYVEMALAAGREWFGETAFELEEMDIVAPIVFDGEHARSLHLEMAPRDGSFMIRSRQRLTDDEWQLHVSGRLSVSAIDISEESVQPANVDGDASLPIEHATHYQLTDTLGLQYGPTFRGLSGVSISGNELVASVELPQTLQADIDDFLLHPALLDLCFQSLVDFFKSEIDAGLGIPFLPVKVGRLQLGARGAVSGFVARMKRRSIRSVLADFELHDAEGKVVARLSDCRFKAAPFNLARLHGPACWTTRAVVKPTTEEARRIDLPGCEELLESTRSMLVENEPALQRGDYFKSIAPLLEALVVTCVYAAFQELDRDRRDWFRHTLVHPESLDEGLQPYFDWLTRMMVTEELLLEDDNGWHLEQTDLPSVEDVWRTLLRDHSAALPELVLIGRLGAQLVPMLLGEISVEKIAEELHGSSQAELLHLMSPVYQGTRFATASTLQTLAAGWPMDRRMRVLELGTVASDLPRQVTEVFPGDNLDYVLAFASDEEVSRAQVDHNGLPWISVVEDKLVLDAEAADASLPSSYDVIVVNHQLHHREKPAQLIGRLHSLLAEGGVLLATERYEDYAADFLLGLDAAWWHKNSDDQWVSCLAAPPSWETALVEQGFADAVHLTEPASDELAEGAYLLMARRKRSRVTTGEENPAKWLLLCDAKGDSRQVADTLKLQMQGLGQQVSLLQAVDEANAGDGACYDPGDKASLQAALDASVIEFGSPDHVVYLEGYRTEKQGLQEQPVELDRQRALHAYIATQAIGQSIRRSPRLWLCTHGGALTEIPGEDYHGCPGDAALWGFGRVVMNEYPEFDCTLLDFASNMKGVAGRVVHEFLHPDDEREVVLSENTRYGLRLVHTTLDEQKQAADDRARFSLDFSAPGQLRNLIWRERAEHTLEADEVEVRPVATGLNFRDVMYLMGLLPDEAVENGFAGASLGLEFSGVVTRVGEDVDGFSVGDEVLGFGSSCFGSHVVTRGNALTHKPASWSFEAAATIPTVFFTVYYSLTHLAHLQPGEKVLIHGAAGGVGIAAVQLARHIGAEVFATAGTPDKREFVRLLGADHVLDSRSLTYADEIMQITAGGGVDVVLNSLAGEAIRRNLRVLKPFGRFLELGKRDFFENTPIGLRPFKDNISYFGIDADQLLIARPELAGTLFEEVMGLFRKGVLTPLPYRAFPAARVEEAFRTMQAARHIGKVVVTFEHQHVETVNLGAKDADVRFDEDGTFLITGGLAGFGLESARWLAERGAGNLVLIGRRGPKTPGAQEAVAELEALGAKVKVAACDVNDREALAELIEQVRVELAPITGVLHAAMVLDDALMANLDKQRFKRVLAPKQQGAWNLHELTGDMPVKHFIMYSSVTTLIGNAGQANYVAGNAFLEGLTALRRSSGLPATCIAWGPIADVGYLTRNEAVKDGLTQRLGAEPLSGRDALRAMGQAIAADIPFVSIADFTWRALGKVLPSSGQPKYDQLRAIHGDGADDTDGMDFLAMVEGKSRDEVMVAVQHLITTELASILCINPDRVDPVRPLHDMGMDSLMGVELAVALESRTGMRLPTMLLAEGPSVERVSSYVTDKLLGEDTEDGQSEEDALKDAVLSVAAQHGENISEDDLQEAVADMQRQTASDKGKNP